MNSIKQIPKAEIHVHLEATISPNSYVKFAKRNNVELLSEDVFGSQYAYAWDDFYDFIKKYDIITSVIHTPEDYKELTYNYLKECASENVHLCGSNDFFYSCKIKRNDLPFFFRRCR